MKEVTVKPLDNFSANGTLRGSLGVFDLEDGDLLWEADRPNWRRDGVVEAAARLMADEMTLDFPEYGMDPDRAIGILRKGLREARRAQQAASDTPAQTQEGSRSKSNALVETILSVEGIEAFHDQFREPHMAWPGEDSLAIYRIESREFRLRLGFHAFVHLGEVPSSETLRAAINTIGGKALYDGVMHPLHVRVAWDGADIVYDLGDGKCVRIAPMGWAIETAPILFRRYANQEPQLHPVSGGNLQDLLGLINLNDDGQKLLFEADIVAGLVPDIPRAVSILQGPQGSAKTTAMRMKRTLMDPTRVKAQGIPKDMPEFVQIASHNLCMFLDNISSLPEWLSDGLTRFCTRDGFIKRTLYTDDDDRIATPMGVGGVNGINLVVTAPDLLDRSLLFNFQRPADSDRREETELYAEFGRLRPYLLGAIFDALSGAMSRLPSIQPASLHRLADYSRWGCAVAVALGYSEADYWKALGANTKSQTVEALEASPVARAVRQFMQGVEEWLGTPTQLLTALNGVAASLGINMKAKAWPQDASWVTRRLKLVVPNLAQVGITFDEDHDGSQRIVTLKTIGFSVSGDGVSGSESEQGNGTDGTNTIDSKSGTFRQRCDCPKPVHFGPEVAQPECTNCHSKLWCAACGGCIGCKLEARDAGSSLPGQ